MRARLIRVSRRARQPHSRCRPLQPRYADVSGAPEPRAPFHLVSHRMPTSSTRYVGTSYTPSSFMPSAFPFCHHVYMRICHQVFVCTTYSNFHTSFPHHHATPSTDINCTGKSLAQYSFCASCLFIVRSRVCDATMPHSMLQTS